MRVRPSARAGVGIWLLYSAIVVGVQATSGIPYTEFGDTASNMWRGPVLSLILGAVVIAAIGAWMGWWGIALRDRYTTGPRWTLVAPGLFLLLGVVILLMSDFSNLGVDFLVAALALGIFVGFAEEFVCRGMLLVGLRGIMREIWVWLLTCVMFGVMHGLNVLLGAPIGETLSQIVLAGMQGSAFYVLRRVTGTLIWAMLLHGFWDFAIFVNGTTGAELGALGLVQFVIAPFALIAGFLVARRTDRDGAYEDYAVGGHGKEFRAQPA